MRKKKDNLTGTEKTFRKIQQDKRRNFAILYSVTIIVFLVIFIYAFSKGYFSEESFFIDILMNMLGILPPLLIFDFFYEKLSKDSSAAETSQKIAETLMGNPETLEAFSEDRRQKFLESTISSIVKDEDMTELLAGHLTPYLNRTQPLQIRTEFSYSIELNNRLPSVYECLGDIEKYFYVQERFRYKVRYLYEKKPRSLSEVKIGFVFENKFLDNVLRDNNDNGDFDNCLFRESLDIEKDDIEYLSQLSSAELKETFEKLFKLDVQIDSHLFEIDDISVYPTGILVRLKTDEPVTGYENVVRIIFHMPKRWDSVLEIVIVDPSKAPKISVSYPEDYMKVDMFSFLTKGKESALATAHEQKNGIYDIALSNEWLFPISGIVFTINKHQPEE